GALTGAALGTFALLPVLGNLRTLLTAVVINATIAAIAGLFSRRLERAPAKPAAAPTTPSSNLSATTSIAARAPGWFVFTAAFLSGFTFFVAELVWYRVS